MARFAWSCGCKSNSSSLPKVAAAHQVTSERAKRDVRGRTIERSGIVGGVRSRHSVLKWLLIMGSIQHALLHLALVPLDALLSHGSEHVCLNALMCS